MTKEQLQKKVNYALSQAKVYEKCTDGSYNAALHYYGYFSALKELTKLNEKGSSPFSREDEIEILNGFFEN